MKQMMEELKADLNEEQTTERSRVEEFNSLRAAKTTERTSSKLSSVPSPQRPHRRPMSGGERRSTRRRAISTAQKAYE